MDRDEAMWQARIVHAPAAETTREAKRDGRDVTTKGEAQWVVTDLLATDSEVEEVEAQAGVWNVPVSESVMMAAVMGTVDNLIGEFDEEEDRVTFAWGGYAIIIEEVMTTQVEINRQERARERERER